MRYNEVSERLQKLTNKIPTQADYMKILDLKQSTISERARRNSKFSPDEIIKLNAHFGVNLYTIGTEKQQSNDKFINIPYWELLPEHLKSLEVDYIPVQRKVIEIGWKLNPEALRIVPMVGDKMSKYWYQIGEDDLLIIDTNQNEILGNGVYFATSLNNTRFWVREMQNLINNDVQIKGYALSGETVKTFTRQQLADVDFNIIGKVIKNVSFRL